MTSPLTMLTINRVAADIQNATTRAGIPDLSPSDIELRLCRQEAGCIA